MLLNGYVRSTDAMHALATLWCGFSFVAIASGLHFILGVFLYLQPLPPLRCAATCCAYLLLQSANSAIMYFRTGVVEIVTAGLAQNISLVVGEAGEIRTPSLPSWNRTDEDGGVRRHHLGLGVRIPVAKGVLGPFFMRRIAAPLFMCTALADQLEEIGQQEEVARDWPARHRKLRLLYRELVDRWERLHGQLRLRFGGRYGTVELPEIDGSVQSKFPRADGEADNETATDFTACVVCWAAPYTHAFWPCGHRCVCRKCALHWSRGRYGNGACVVCQRAAVDCAQVYDA